MIKSVVEKAAQHLFFTMAYSYFKANNLDVTSEADAGNGPVDIKFPQVLIIGCLWI